MPTISDKTSFLSPCGYQDGSCGYCKNPETSQRTPRSRGSLFATSKTLTVDHYQQLVNRGWRRSGTTLYKPDQIRSCCPHYTIRLPVADIHVSKDQRQALHRWNRFVLGEKYLKDSARLHPKTKEAKKQEKNKFELLSTVHASEYDKVEKSLEPEHRFEVTLESNDFTEEKYRLFEQYQRLVHKEPPSRISKKGFKNFLCDSPLVKTTIHDDEGNPRSLGSFHQCYRLDGQLIAIGVIDLLPYVVSAVYFIYHLDYEKWSFGKLSALREAALAFEGGYQYYNMGFYIHSCAKMRYKCDYKPQYLLDPDTYEWHLLDDVLKAKLDRRKFVSPSRDRVREEGHCPSESMEVGLADGTNGEEHSNFDHPEKYANPNEAFQSGDALLSFGMPGIMSREEVNAMFEAQPPLIAIGNGDNVSVLPATALVAWEEGPVTEASGYIKQVIADLVAAVGPNVAEDMVIDFTSA